MDWYNCSITFIKTFETKNFSKAAKYLHVSSSIISKRIQWLEHHLNQKLIKRTTRDFRVTDAGYQYYNRIAPLLVEWGKVKFDISKSDMKPGGVFRVAMPTIAGNYYIEKLNNKFSKLYPDIKVELILGGPEFSFTEKKVDVKISTTDSSKEGGFLEKKIRGPIRRIYASPRYLHKHGEPSTIQELQNHNCISRANQMNNVWKFSQDIINVNGNFLCNNTPSLLKAVESGYGICFIADIFLEDKLQNNQIKHILPIYHSDPIELYLSFPAYEPLSINAQVFKNFIETELSFPT